MFSILIQPTTLFLISPLFLIILYGYFQRQQFRRLKTSIDYYAPPRESYWKGKTILVLINPMSGTRCAEISYRQIIEPMMMKAGILLKPMTTKTHLGQLLSEDALQSIDGILCTSGDGLLHQVINHIANRRSNIDAMELKRDLERTPIGIIPCGSSNGISASLGSFSIFSATRRIIESIPRQIDLFEVRQGERTYHDMHSFSWAGIAAYDNLVESRWRWMGMFKHILASVYLLLKNPKFQGRVEIVPVAEIDPDIKDRYTDPKKLPKSETNPLAYCIEGCFSVFTAMNLPYGSTEHLFAPNVRVDDGSADLVIFRNARRIALCRLLVSMNDGSHLKIPGVEVYKVQQFKLMPKDSNPYMTLSGEPIGKEPILLKVHPKLATVM